ncbi:MAG: nucleotidyltransferase domain-containing protein [Chitinophagales bacterium]
MTLQELQHQGLKLFEVITGSQAYGLALPTSDIDLKGVFALPQTQLWSLDYTPQVNDAKNDIVFYELQRFIDLLYKNNPNLLEMLNVSSDCVRFRHSVMDWVKPELFLSKLCHQTFAGYAFSQIKKARGLNKKIVNPMSKDKKTPLDFSYITMGQGSMSVVKWLQKKGWKQEYCGLVNVPHFKDVMALYYDLEAHETNGDNNLKFKGIIQKSTSNDISLSSIPKDMKPVTYLHFNHDGYKKYCKDYRDYWSWVDKRNDVRYKNTISHGKNYDAKNMMHTFRLLDMAAEIATEKRIVVKRPNREFLLKIRRGEFEYQELVGMAEEKANRIEELFAKSDLQDEPDKEKVNEILVRMRRELLFKKS